jgi:type I restriction enzyme S subunit
MLSLTCSRVILNHPCHSLSSYVPLLDEQESIAKILSCLDRKIENLRKQNETLEAIAQTLFKHWFIDFEFPNADGKPYKSSGGAMEPSELGKTPAGWRVGSLGDAVKVNAESIGKGYPHKNIEYVDISSVGVGVLEGTTSYQLKKAPSRARRLVKHGDVIWSGVRPNRKSYFFIAHPPGNLVVSTGFITLTPNLIPSSYLYSWVTTDSFVEYLTFNASGSAYPAVKAEHFEIANILLPDKLNLSRFHAVVDPMREKIQQNSQQIQTLTKTRDVLLPKLMSGKLRINP